MARASTSVRSALACLALTTAAGFAEEIPDAELFEYLGSWEASDGEWVALLDWQEDEDRPEPETNEEQKDER